jgi:uncharacterized protein (DUF2147 family)
MHITFRGFGAALVVAVGALLGAAPAAAQAMVEGNWKSGNGSEIVIAPCSAGYCGTLTKPAVSDADLAKYGDAQTAMASFVDEHNEDKSLRERPLVGLEMLRIKATNNPWYFEGEVYNPSDGKTYSGAITVLGADAMMLKGCALFVFCREEQWNRVTQ